MKTIFDSMDEVPDNLKDKVVAVGDGTFTFEGTGLVDKNKELLGEVNKLKGVAALLKGLDTTGMTPEKIKAALEEHEKSGEREAEIQSRIQAAVQENSRLRAGEVDAANKKVQEMESSLQEYLLDRELTSAIAAEKGNPLFIAPVLRNQLKVVREVISGKPSYTVRVLGEGGKDIALDSSGQPLTVAALVQNAKKDSKFASVFEAPVSSGAGLSPGTQGGGQQGGGQQTSGGLVKGADGKVILTREQGKDASLYREALKLVDNKHSNVVFADAASSQPAA